MLDFTQIVAGNFAVANLIWRRGGEPCV